MAGKGKGRDEAGRLHAAVEACRDGWRAAEGSWSDDTAPLVLEVLRWTDALDPTWVACEQVPPVLGLWRHMADVLRDWGYSAEARKLCAADWGVPQTRRRAFLVAHRDGVTWPEPTHAESPHPGLFSEREPWVTMAEALGWDTGSRALDRRVGGFAKDAKAVGDDRPAPTLCLSNGREVWRVRDGRGESIGGYDRSPEFGVDRPSRVLTEKARSWTLRGNNSVAGEGRAERDDDEPALTVGGRADLWRFLRHNNREHAVRRPITEPAGSITVGHHLNEIGWVYDPEDRVNRNGRRISIEEAAALQGFPPDYPFRGSRTSKFRQIGNAVPPPWAEAILGALT